MSPMDVQVKAEYPSPRRSEDDSTPRSGSVSTPHSDSKPRSRKSDLAADSAKRRCVSTACIACRRRKSKCDGNLPACAACSSVYGTDCIYDPNSDHRRKGVYKKDIDSLKTRNSTLQTLIHAILNYPEDQVPDLVRRIRTCESLDKVAEGIVAKDNGEEEPDNDQDVVGGSRDGSDSPTFESQLSSKMGSMRLDDGTVRFIGGTSNLMFMGVKGDANEGGSTLDESDQPEYPTTSWTNVTTDPDLVKHLLNHYFTWHYTFFTILPKSLFYKQFLMGIPPTGSRRKTEYCTPLLVNVLLALGCHFTSNPGAREDPEDSATAGDHFFKEAKRLLYEEDEIAKPSLATVQALALMSVREAGCAREANGWNYSGMAFRMSCDLGLSFQTSTGYMLSRVNSLDEEEEDARRVTFWGCFQIDKCWSNYLGRLPQFQISANVTIPRYDVFPVEDADIWSPYSDSGFNQAHSQPSRVRAVALQISVLCDISSDLIKHFYHPQTVERPVGKQAELKQLSDLHSRLEEWRRNLPRELEPKEGILSSVLIMHMFFQLLFIHLFRPFLKYTQATSPLPAHVSPRKLCTQAAVMISKLLRLYKRSHGLRHIVNFAVYIAHSACTIHLLNLPEKTAKRDITHGVKHLEEIAEGWLAARRTLSVLSMQARKWKSDLPDEAVAVLERTDKKYGALVTPATKSPLTEHRSPLSVELPEQLSPMPSQQMVWEPQSDYHPTNEARFSGENPHVTNSMTTKQEAFPPTGSSVYQLTPQYYAVASQPALGIDSTITASTQNPNSASQMLYEAAARSQNQHTPSQQHEQARRMTPLQPHVEQPMSSQPFPKNNFYPANPSAGMFGGVEALLREGHEWWMKDQTSDLASGFGNWHGGPSAGGFEVAEPGPWIQQGSQQHQQHHQQHQHQHQHQQQLPQQRQMKHRQDSWTGPQPANPTQYVFEGSIAAAAGQKRTSVVGGGNEAFYRTMQGAGAAAYLDGTATAGASAGLGYGFGTLMNDYNEDEWYQ